MTECEFDIRTPRERIPKPDDSHLPLHTPGFGAAIGRVKGKLTSEVGCGPAAGPDRFPRAPKAARPVHPEARANFDSKTDGISFHEAMKFFMDGGFEPNPSRRYRYRRFLAGGPLFRCVMLGCQPLDMGADRTRPK